MTDKQQVISKGPYNHSQPKGFMTLKQYIFLRKEGQKCLMLKFFNDTDFFINLIRFRLIQLNSEGNVICEETVEFGALSIPQGVTYTPDARIVVNEKCMDFKVVFDYIESGMYRYCLIGGKAVPTYKETENWSYSSFSINERPKFNVSSCKAGKQKNVTLLAVLIGFLVSVLAFVPFLWDFVESEILQNTESEEYTELSDESFTDNYDFLV